MSYFNLKVIIKRHKLLYKSVCKLKNFLSANKYHKWFVSNQQITTLELKKQSDMKFINHPLISIIVPVYNPPLKFLQNMLDSVVEQSYPNWELCIADGNSRNEIKSLLRVYMERDARIKVDFLSENLHICGNSNAALSIANGEFIGLLDHDDLLAPQCLYEYVKTINMNYQTDILYCDEDFYSDGKHLLAHFKPDFALDSLHEMNYITHFVVFRTKLLEKISSPVFNSDYQGAQDYDLILRLVEKAEKVVHIPQVLYHWRMHNNSTLGNPDSKNYAYENGRKAVESHLCRTGYNAAVNFRKDMLGVYKVSYELKFKPLVSIIIPNKNQLQMLDSCIQSLLHNTNYDNFEIIIIENNSDDSALFEYYKRITSKNINVVYYPETGFNYAKINNWGINHANGEFIVFLNNDTNVFNTNWLTEMLQYAQIHRVGAVGAKLLFPDNTIQHAGIVIARNSIPGNLFDSHDNTNIAQFARTHRVQNLSAVTGACLMVKKSKFIEVGGFDEKLAVAFNDVDFCLKLLQAGYYNVFNPDAVLYHYESKSRGYENNPTKKNRFNEEYSYFKTKWGSNYHDAYYPDIYDNYNYTWK